MPVSVSTRAPLEVARKRVAPVAVACLFVALAVFGISTYLARASGATDVAARAASNAELIRSAELALGLGTLADAAPHLGRGPAGPLAAGLYSAGYWPFLLLALAVTVRRDRRQFHRLWFAVSVSGLFGLVVMALFPVAPPRLLGAVDVVAAHGLDGIAHPRGLVNPHAAMPSFHVGWSVVAACAMASVAPRLRGWVWLQPVAMSFAVVATANHYLLDVAAGAALGLGAWRATTAPWLRSRLPGVGRGADQDRPHVSQRHRSTTVDTW